MYKIIVPRHVRKQIRECRETDEGHLKPHLERLPEQLDRLSTEPKSGFPVRRDFTDAWFIEVGDYRLYYVVDELSGEIRFFWFDRYYLGW